MRTDNNEKFNNSNLVDKNFLPIINIIQNSAKEDIFNLLNNSSPTNNGQKEQSNLLNILDELISSTNDVKKEVAQLCSKIQPINIENSLSR